MALRGKFMVLILPGRAGKRETANLLNIQRVFSVVKLTSLYVAAGLKVEWLYFYQQWKEMDRSGKVQVINCNHYRFCKKVVRNKQTV